MSIDDQLLEEIARLEGRVEQLENENATLKLQNDTLQSQGLLRRNFWREARRDITLAVEQRGQAEKEAKEYRSALEEVYGKLLDQPENLEVLERIRNRMSKVEKSRFDWGENSSE